MGIAAETLRWVLLLLAAAFPVMAADIPAEAALIKNVNIFDGENETLPEGYDVIVVRNLVKQVAKDIPTEGTCQLDVKTGGLRKTTVQGGGICLPDHRGRESITGHSFAHRSRKNEPDHERLQGIQEYT